MKCLFVLFAPYSCIWICHTNAELLSPFNQSFSIFFCRSITNVGHKVHAFELSTNSVINTFGLPPVTFYFVISVTLMTDELLSSFFDNLRARSRCNRHVVVFM